MPLPDRPYITQYGLNSISERVHHCEKCGYKTNRDTAAAQVIENYLRGMERASSDAESSSSTECGSMKQLGAKKRRKSQQKRGGNSKPHRQAEGVVHVKLF